MRKRVHLPHVIVIFFTILVAIIINAYILNFNMFDKSLYEGSLIIFILNLIPLVIFNLLLLFLFNNFIFSNFTFFILVIVLEVANINKIKFRGSPISINDYTLISEVFNIKGAVPPSLIISIVVGIILLLAFSFVLNTLISGGYFKIAIRIVGIVILIFIFIFCNKFLFSKDNKNIEYPFNLVEQYDKNGLIYSAFYNYNKALSISGITINETMEEENWIDGIPPLFSEVDLNYNFENKTTEDILNQLPKEEDLSEPEEYPNIIFIMNEAYSDIGKNPDIDISNFKPYENYDKAVAEGYEGRMVVPNVGGGTSDTEFDMMTMLNARFFRDAAFGFEKVKNPINSIPNSLRDLDYDTRFIHPYENWYYTRDLYIPKVGFNEYLDNNYFIDAERVNDYINTGSVYELINQLITEKNAEGLPSYIYATTIENHGPHVDKFSVDPLEYDNIFTTDIDLTDEERNALANYLYAIKEEDNYLQELIDSINLIEKPTILVFFGDHLPSLPTYEMYDKIVEHEDTDLGNMTYMYQNPYLIYENTASKETFGLVENLENTEIPELISSFYVPMILFNGLGINFDSSYFDFVNSYMEYYPLIFEYNYFDRYYNLQDSNSNPYIQYLKNVDNTLIKGVPEVNSSQSKSTGIPNNTEIPEVTENQDETIPAETIESTEEIETTEIIE